MNALSLLRATEYIGAKELRVGLEKILRTADHPYRVMLRNKPTVTILPDDQFLQLLEILEELRGLGLLEKARRKLQEESRKKHPWFWSEAWQKGERKVDEQLKTGRVKRFPSVGALFKYLGE